MIADRKWVERNLGFDPISTPPPPSSFAVKRVAKASVSRTAKVTSEDFQREIIDFDSESAAGRDFMAFSTATGLSRFTDIPWPKGLAPKTGPKPKGSGSGPLPKADVLVVTWTVDEGHALSRVLTPGKDSRNDYLSYTHNFAAIAKSMRKGCPALEAKRLGAYWTTTIGKKSVVVFKSDSHMSQDGPKLPNIQVWRQIIQEVNPSLVITTGTAGGIGKQFEVGDVIVSPIVRFDCISKFKKQPFAQAHYSSTAAKSTQFATAQSLFKANSAQLPKDNTRAPKIFRVAPTALTSSVVTTDFFGFDTSDNHFKLQGLGDVSEMGDGILGLVTSEMGKAAPRWLAIRNVSDPQIKAEGTLKQQEQVAAQIYKGFGRWSTVCSAITCWASIVAEP
jgi:purine-nucleoside phosphorylase